MIWQDNIYILSLFAAFIINNTDKLSNKFPFLKNSSSIDKNFNNSNDILKIIQRPPRYKLFLKELRLNYDYIKENKINYINTFINIILLLIMMIL